MRFSGVLSGAAVVVCILATCVHASEVVETRGLTFEEDQPGTGWPNFEWIFFGGLFEVEFFLWEFNTLYFHIPTDLELRYESCDVHPSLIPGTNQTVDLHWTLTPLNGPGREYERESGFKGALQVLIWEPEVKGGFDYEESFAAPHRGDSHVMQDFLGVLSWAKNCAAGIDVGTVYQYELQGNRFHLILEIVSPTMGVEWSNGQRSQPFDFTAPQLTTPLTLTSTYLGQDIEIRANFPVAHFQEEESMSLWISIYGRECLFEARHEAKGVFPWFVPTGGDSLTVFYDDEESDDLRWTLHALDVQDVDDCINSGLPRNDLTVTASRTSADDYPTPGQTDQIRVLIENRQGYGDPCVAYSSISADYSLHAGATGHPVNIGTQTYTTSDQELLDFNNGISNQLQFTFDFTPSNPQYFFQPDRQWPLRSRPYYMVQVSVTPDTMASSCPSWAAKEDPRNNHRVVPFEAPLPEFRLGAVPDVCVDTDSDAIVDHCLVGGTLCSNNSECFSIYDGYPFFPALARNGESCVDGECEFSGYFCETSGDCSRLKFDFRVTNLGVSWPPLGATVDPVEVSGRIVFEKEFGTSWQPIASDIIGAQVVTPLAAGASKDFSFQYQVHSASLPPLYSRARVVFEVNGADGMGNRIVSERNYENNAHEIVLHRYPPYVPPIPSNPSETSGSCRKVCVTEIEGTRVLLEVAQAGRIHERIYDVRGRLVADLGTRDVGPGTYARSWDERGNDGQRVARGVYFYEAIVGEERVTARLMLLR